MTFSKTLFAKTAMITGLALAALTPVAAVHAGVADDAIQVTSQAAMEEWQANATASLNRSLARPESSRSLVAGDGIVQLRFKMGPDGQPANIEVVHSSANWAAERDARRAVRRLGDISDVPVTNASDAQFLANIVFAKTTDQHAELLVELEKAMSLGFAVESENLILLGG